MRSGRLDEAIDTSLMHTTLSVSSSKSFIVDHKYRTKLIYTNKTINGMFPSHVIVIDIVLPAC